MNGYAFGMVVMNWTISFTTDGLKKISWLTNEPQMQFPSKLRYSLTLLQGKVRIGRKRPAVTVLAVA